MSELERYQNLGLRESLSRRHDYSSACDELSIILRRAYNQLPKNLQNIIFQDTLLAFRLLHRVRTKRDLSSSNLLLQAAEASLPKQKRSLAVSEYRHAVIAQKRYSKFQEEGTGCAQLPQDLLVHIFSFLDMHSLVSAGLVCWSWNSAANDNTLWATQYTLFFGDSNSDQHSGQSNLFEGCCIDIGIHIEDRKKFKTRFIGNSSWKASNRIYCRHCDTIMWLSSIKCGNSHHVTKGSIKCQIKPISSEKVVEYVLGKYELLASSSDSDSDSDSDCEYTTGLGRYFRVLPF